VGEDFANKFPSLQDSVEMARLSKLVYHFKHEEDDYCANFSNSDGVQCEWYFHNMKLGTQVLLVSNHRQRYFAVVFAGTDDLRTSLEDVDICKIPFGNNSTISLDDPRIKVHAGFDNAVFSDGLWEEISSRLLRLTRRHPLYRIWTTGHSLGAANSVMTATALASKGYHVTALNFGCPQTGNKAWHNYFNTTSPVKNRLAIWRVVLGWDLVARLPEFFYHAGHTIQLWSEDHQKYDKHNPNLVEAYYEHYGEAKLGYAGVPTGWSSKPYAWMPGALTYHFIAKYVEDMEHLAEMNIWVDSFKALQPVGYDDDIYDEPPDDWYGAEYFDDFESEEEEKTLW
jgi:hypothetical protein